MQEVYEFLKKCGTYYLATTEGDQPRVRPFGTVDLFEGKLYIQTGKKKEVSKQLQMNPKAEICAFGGGKWIRVSGKLIRDDRVEAKRHMLDAYPGLKGMYSAEDDNTEVLYFDDAEAVISSFSEAPKTIRFSAPKKFRWCFVGSGTLAVHVAKLMQASGRHEITSVYTRRFEKGEEFAALYGGKAYPTLEEAVSAEDVDGVYVVTPHNSHYQSVKTALEFGRPVLCEKPFTMTAAEAKELFELAEEKQVYLAEAMWTWFSPVANKVDSWVKEKAFGEISKIRLNHKVNVLNYAPRLTDPNLAGGAVLDTGVYPLTYAYRLFGKPVKVECCGEVEKGVDLRETVTLTFEDGSILPIGISIADTPSCEELYIKGDKAELMLPGFHVAREAVLKNTDGSQDQVSIEEPMIHEFDCCAEEIRGKKTVSSYVPPRATIEVMEIIDECRRQMQLIYPFETKLP